MTQLVLTGHKNFTPIELFMYQLVVLDPQNKINSTGVPQGSVLGPLLLNLYMVLLVTIIKNHNISCHSYTDDVHLYSAFSSDDLTCTDDINCWMPPNLLEQKQHRDRKMWSYLSSLSLKYSVKNRNFTILDSVLSFDDHLDILLPYHAL